MGGLGVERHAIGDYYRYCLFFVRDSSPPPVPLPVGNTLAQNYAIRPLVYHHPVHLILLPSLIVLVVGIKWLVR